MYVSNGKIKIIKIKLIVINKIALQLLRINTEGRTTTSKPEVVSEELTQTSRFI